ILITPSSTIPSADTAMPTTGKIKFCPSYPPIPTSPLIASVMDAGLMSVDTEMTVACKIQPVCIKLTLSLINSDLAVDQAEGPLQETVNCLQHSAPILTGSC
ncbi:hypothetical protein K443DRAFT_35320, partial [Laccaria amethystina LaAM-08-1]